MHLTIVKTAQSPPRVEGTWADQQTQPPRLWHWGLAKCPWTLPGLICSSVNISIEVASWW